MIHNPLPRVGHCRLCEVWLTNTNPPNLSHQFWDYMVSWSIKPPPRVCHCRLCEVWLTKTKLTVPPVSVEITPQNVACINILTNKTHRLAACLQYVEFECPKRLCIFLQCVRVVCHTLRPRMSNVVLKYNTTSFHTLPSSLLIFSSISRYDIHHHHHHHYYVVCLTLAP
jgi:hypothetical protein